MTFTSPVYIENVDRAVGTSLQLMAETDVENETVGFRLVEVTDGQGRVVSLNSSGYLTIAPGANVTTFFIDVSFYSSLLRAYYTPVTGMPNFFLQYIYVYTCIYVHCLFFRL